MYVIRAGIHACQNSKQEDPDQTASHLKKQSDLGRNCLPRHFSQATCVKNFRTSIILYLSTLNMEKYARSAEAQWWSA